jgi:hypothetical protein
MGAASAVVAFFRSMGGSIGVSVLGALLSHQVTAKLAAALPGGGQSSNQVPDLASLPAPVRAIVEAAFGESFGHIFLVATPFAALALVCVMFIREVPLRTSNLEAEAEASPEVAAEVHHALAKR